MRHSIKLLTLLAASAAIFAACAKDNPSGNDGGSGKLSLNATRDNSTWSEGDALSVFDGVNNNTKFSLIDGVGKSEGMFTGTAYFTSGSYVALHPYQMSVSYSEFDGELRGVVLKSEQTAVAGGTDPEASVMTAVSSKSGSTLAFKDAVGYVKLVTGFACTKITLVSNSQSNALAGTMDIRLSLSGVPTVAVRSDASVSQVSLTGTIEAGNAYYIALCPMTISGGYKLVFTSADGSEKSKEFTEELIIAQGKTVDLGRFDEEQFAGKTPYVTFSAESMQIFKMSLVDGIGSLEYSVAGGDWKAVVSGEGVAFGGSAGDLRLRGKSAKGTAILDSQRAEYSQISFADDGVPVTVAGDIRTLIDWENYETASTADARFPYLFSGCSSLDSTLELPATVLADYCYEGMFFLCTSLSMAPELPATNLDEGCYSLMFAYCISLKVAPELPAMTLARVCYSGMFQCCESLTDAPDLPAATLISACYERMFSYCTSLKTAPVLPATTLTEYCYKEMFRGCTSLKASPELPATKLADYCYDLMFGECASLTDVPVLPAKTLTLGCYSQMFSGCQNLKEVTIKATDASAKGALSGWLSGVASSGTIHKRSKLDLPADSISGIPTGWTAVNDVTD